MCTRKNFIVISKRHGGGRGGEVPCISERRRTYIIYAWVPKSHDGKANSIRLECYVFKRYRMKIFID